MQWQTLLVPALASLASAAEMYSKSSPVLQLTSRSYDAQITKSNYTSIVEFYAPWCGHCQNLKPAYEKAASALDGLGKVAAVNCDDDANKPLCGKMGVKGFPTLKIVRPGKKPGKPRVDDYMGERTAKAIRDAVVDKMPNHVQRVKDDSVEKFVEADPEKPKALFFGQKGLVPAFVKALAVDFKGVVDVGYARDADKEVLKRFDVKGSPAVVVLPGNGAAHVLYDGEVKKAPLLDFMSKYATPNPDALPKEAKTAKSSKKAKSKKTKEDL